MFEFCANSVTISTLIHLIFFDISEDSIGATCRWSRKRSWDRGELAALVLSGCLNQSFVHILLAHVPRQFTQVFPEVLRYFLSQFDCLA